MTGIFLNFLLVNLYISTLTKADTQCKFQCIDGMIECAFTNEKEDIIRECISKSTKKVLMKSLTINSPFVTDIKNIISNETDMSKLETLIITNANISLVDLSTFKMPELKTLSLIRNNMLSLDLGNLPNLLNLDLSHNELNQFSLSSSSIKFLNLSYSFSSSAILKNIVSTNAELIDLSNNNLMDISFLNLQTLKLQTLKLQNNRIFNFRSIESVTKSIYNLTIDISENLLECSMMLTKDWLNFKVRKINFVKDPECTFENSTNKYLISKYGYMFEKEQNILDALWNDTLLQTYSDAKYIKFLISTLLNGFKIEWKLEKPLIFNFTVLFKGNDLYPKNIIIKNNQSEEFNNVYSVTEICFLSNIPKRVTTGVVYVNVSIYCQNVTAEKNISAIGFIISIVIIILLFIIATSLAIFFYCKMKKSPIRSDEMELSSKISTHNRETIVARNISDGLPPVFDNRTFNIDDNNPLTRTMERDIHHQSRISSNIYETMENNGNSKDSSDLCSRNDIQETYDSYVTMA